MIEYIPLMRKSNILPKKKKNNRSMINISQESTFSNRAPAGIFLEGARTVWTKMTFFDAPTVRTKLYAVVRRFGLNLRVFDASAENFRHFARQ